MLKSFTTDFSFEHNVCFETLNRFIYLIQYFSFSWGLADQREKWDGGSGGEWELGRKERAEMGEGGMGTGAINRVGW